MPEASRGGACGREALSGIRRGWRFGAEDFLERLLEAGVAENANREIHEGDAVAETMEEKSTCVIAEFLGKRKVGLEELRALKKGDPLKIELAAELRKQTPMSMGWIARELNAGAPNSVWNAMRRLQDRGEVGKKGIISQYVEPTPRPGVTGKWPGLYSHRTRPGASKVSAFPHDCGRTECECLELLSPHGFQFCVRIYN